MSTSKPDIPTISQEFLSVTKKAALAGLVWSSSGNMSMRIDAERFIISGSGASLMDLTAEDLAICQLDGEDFEGTQPSIETGILLSSMVQAPSAISKQKNTG